MSKQFLEEEEIYNLAGEDPNANPGADAPEDEEQPNEEQEEIVDIDKGGKGEGYSAS